MDISLTLEKGLLMSAANESGARIMVGKPADYPGATSPMEMVLEAIAGCSSIDILMILEKQKAAVRRYDVQVHGEREQGNAATPFTEIVLHYAIDTDASEEKALRAVQLSVEKYCSVAKMLEKSVNIRYTLSVNGHPVEPHTL